MKTIVFYSEKGGTGTTNICAAFARRLSKANISVGIIALGGQPGVYSLMTPDITNVQISRTENPLDRLNDVITAIASMETKPQLLCIDCPLNFKPVLTLLLSIGIVSLVVVPIVAEPMAYRAASSAYNYLQGLGIRPLFIRNMVTHDDDPEPEYLKPIWNHRLVANDPIIYGKDDEGYVTLSNSLIKEIETVLDAKTNVSGIRILDLNNLPYCPQIVWKNAQIF